MIPENVQNKLAGVRKNLDALEAQITDAAASIPDGSYSLQRAKQKAGRAAAKVEWARKDIDNALSYEEKQAKAKTAIPDARAKLKASAEQAEHHRLACEGALTEMEEGSFEWEQTRAAINAFEKLESSLAKSLNALDAAEQGADEDEDESDEDESGDTYYSESDED